MKYPQLVSMPSAVSDWLEEQLEARGIDAVVYTRYVLSLLYRDPVDIICPDQDLHFTNPNKDVRRSGGGRKRFCRSSNYWGYADAEQLKRSAAVECLKSASDQKCGIESLVDELCEKLKEISNDSDKAAPEETNNNKSKVEQPKGSVQDPAKRYYAAFPALSRNTSTSSPNLITLIPKWFGSPKKKAPRKQNRSVSFEDKLHMKIDSENMKSRSVGKQRFNYFSRNKKDVSFTRNVNKSMDRSETDWDFLNNNTFKMNKSMNGTEDFNAELLWDNTENHMNMYDDLPVDIRGLLTSPTPQAVNLEMMNMANMRETGNKKFIQCGTNIINSIWSNDAPMEDYENDYNSTLSQSDDFKYCSIDKSVWSLDVNIIKDNETNSFFENCAKGYNYVDDEWSFGKLTKWSDTYDFEIDNVVMNSLMKLNHNKDESSFIEVKPRLAKIGSKNVLNAKKDDNKMIKNEETCETDNLLHSASSHFRPINEKMEFRHGNYSDGTTFVIPNSLEPVNFKRSDSGTMYLDAESTTPKKYYEYKKANDDFILKFNVIQNDKACQTECIKDIESDVNDVSEIGGENEFYFPGDQELLECEEKAMNCTCKNNLDNLVDDENCAVHLTRPDSMMAEIFGKFELKCDKCNNNNTSVWSKGWSHTKDNKNDDDSNKQSLRNIWSGGEVCMACLGLSGGGPPLPSQEQKQLREDITQDGEQLLSDLRIIQKSYMEEIPIAEVSCNINNLIETSDWKSVIQQSVPIHSGSFSFATRLQQDCLIKMATIPTLRSITL